MQYIIRHNILCPKADAAKNRHNILYVQYLQEARTGKMAAEALRCKGTYQSLQNSISQGTFEQKSTLRF